MRLQDQRSSEGECYCRSLVTYEEERKQKKLGIEIGKVECINPLA